MDGTIRELCSPREDEPTALMEFMEKVPGYRSAIQSLYDFMVNPQEPGDAAVNQEPADLLETVGLERSRNLALTFFALNYEMAAPAQFDWTPLWRHQIAVGVIIDFLYDVLNLRRSGLEYVTGLTHDLGKTILAEMFPFAFFTALTRAFQEKIPLAPCESEMFGIDHAELMAHWLREHEFSPALAEAIALHETPDKIKKNLLAHALVSANHLVKQIGIGFCGNSVLDPRPWAEIPSTIALWEGRGNKEYSFEDFTRDILGQFEYFPDLL